MAIEVPKLNAQKCKICEISSVEITQQLKTGSNSRELKKTDNLNIVGWRNKI